MACGLLVGTDDGLHEVGNGRETRLAGHKLDSIAKDASGWWAVLDGREVWHAEADDWAQVALLEDLKANCVLASEAGLLVGTSEAHLVSLRDGELQRVEPFEATQGRDTWHTPWGGPPDVRSMSADPEGPVYVNVHVGGVPRSTDGGGSWQPTVDIQADVHQVLFDPGSRPLLVAAARGLGVSDDGGDSWRFHADGLHGRYLRAVAVAGDTVLVTASTGPYTERAAVYRRPIQADGPFERCQSGLPEWFSGNIDTFCLAGADAEAAFGTSDGRVYRSSDEGASWTEVAGGLSPVRCLAFR